MEIGDSRFRLEEGGKRTVRYAIGLSALLGHRCPGCRPQHEHRGRHAIHGQVGLPSVDWVTAWVTDHRGRRLLRAVVT